MDIKGKEKGILKSEGRPRSADRAELTPEGSCDRPPLSPQPSVDRLSVTWAEPTSMTSGVNLFHLPSDTPINNDIKFSPSAGDGSDDEDYSASLSAVLRQRRASVRRSRKGRVRRPSSPFQPDDRSRRRSSVFTTSSGDTAISIDDSQPAIVTQQQIFENIHLHKEVLGSVKQQPLGMRRKLKIVHQAKGYIKRHEGQLQERLAQSKSTKNIYARFNILMTTKWHQLKREAANLSNLLIPWELRIKEIESHFGSVVASYFTFLRWLFWVNLVIGFILLVFVIIPEYLTAKVEQDGERKIIMDEERYNSTKLLTLWEFEGVLKYSPIFYGYYSNINVPEYRMPLAYFLTGLVVYIYSFVAILRKMAENSRMSKLSEKEDECIFSWKLFTGWDYMIGNAETAHNRIASVILGFKEALLEEAEKKKDVRNWRNLFLRGLVNIFVVILLAISAYAVVTVVSRSNVNDDSKAQGWWRENETTIVVTVISITFPVLFELLGFFEHYHPRKQLRLQLARIMLLNLLNLYSLIFALFNKIDDMSEDLNRLKPTIDINATVASEATLNITETLVNTVPQFCHEVKISCLRCDIHFEFSTSKKIIATETTLPVTSYKPIYNSSRAEHKILENLEMPNNSKVMSQVNVYKLTSNLVTDNNIEDTNRITELGLQKVRNMTILYPEAIDTIETGSDLNYTYDDIFYTSTDENVTVTIFQDEKKSSTEVTSEKPFDEYAFTNIDNEWLENEENTITTSELNAEVTWTSDVYNLNSTTDASTSEINTGTETSRNTLFKENNNVVTESSTDLNATNIYFKSTDSTYGTEFTSNIFNSTTAVNTESDLSTYKSTDTAETETYTSTPNVSNFPATITNIFEFSTHTTITPTTKNDIDNFTSSGNNDSTGTVLISLINETDTTTTTTEIFTKDTELSTIEKETICPDITYNCSIKCGKNNITQVVVMSNCQIKEKSCYLMQCSTLNIKNNNETNINKTKTLDFMYKNKNNITMYKLSKETRIKLLKLCWETMFGQELVKLTMMDLLFVLLGTLFMDFFRALFVRYMNRCWCWNLEKKFPEYGDFKIAENILHLINNQGMVWMGMFFSPGLVVLNVFKLVIMMYLRSWAVMTCNVPHEVIFRVSKSNNFYLALLLTMLFLCVLPVGYSIVWVKPSWHCGPFSEYEKIYQILTNNIDEILPGTSLKFALSYIASPAIVIPLLVLLILIIYYLISLTNSLREANNDLKIQLRRERTEERRKMFQIADNRRRVGSSMDNTPFARWKKALPSLPFSKSIDSDERKTVGEEHENPKFPKKKAGGIFAKIVNMATKANNLQSDIQTQASSYSENLDDETDTDFHETLPKEVLKVKDITINKSVEKEKKKIEFRTSDIYPNKSKLTDNEHKKIFIDKEKLLVEQKSIETIDQENNIDGLVGKNLDRDKLKDKSYLNIASDLNQTDSSGTIIPVITISTTESDEESNQVKKEKNIISEHDTNPPNTKRTVPDLKALRRQNSVDSTNEYKISKKPEDGHKYQYSL